MADSAVRRELVAAVRVAARPEMLDAASWPAGATALRLAVDEILVLDALDVGPPEPDAIVFPDMGWVRFVVPASTGPALMARAAAWPAPTSGFAQGMIAGVPAKVVVGDPTWWFIVPAVVADEFGERLHEVTT